MRVFQSKRHKGIRLFYSSTRHGAGIFDTTSMQWAHWPAEFDPTTDRLEVAFRLVDDVRYYGRPVAAIISEHTLRAVFLARERAAA